MAEGGTCDANTPCEVSLACIAGKCGKGLAAGAPCKNGMNETPCSSSAGLYCKPPSATVADGTCTTFTVATANQLCGITLQPAVDFAKPPDCQFPAKCRDGKCAVLDPTVCK